MSQLRSSSAVSMQELRMESTAVRLSPVANGGLEIVLRAKSKIDDSRRFPLRRLKELIQKNYELLDQSP